MQTVESEIGKITFRLPNIAEGPELLALCGLNSRNASDQEWFKENDLLIMSRVIKHMGFLIKEIIIDGKKVEKYDDLLCIMKSRDLVMLMANDVLESLGGEDKKN